MSIPVDGSSRMTTGGSPIIAIATDNLRLFPPLNAYDGLSACFNKSNSTNFSMTTCISVNYQSSHDNESECSPQTIVRYL